ncbi:MAG: carboxypeptidase-like regulatory domain-containing protein [Thermoguttaceae bacterium]
MIEVTPGESTSDVRFTVGRGLVINGRVTDPQGKPVADAEVKTLRLRNDSRFKEAVTQTDAQGRFTLAGLPASDAQELQIKHGEQKLIEEVLVEADEQAEATRIVNIDVQLQPGATVKGHLLVDGRPMAGRRIDLYRSRPHEREGYAIQVAQVAHAKTDDAGRFEIQTILPGKGFFLSNDEEQFSGLNSNDFSLESGQVYESPTLEMRQRAKSVSGRIVDPEGNPVAGGTVKGRALVHGRAIGGIPVDLRQYRTSEGETRCVFADRAYTDDGGRFEFDAVPAGAGFQVTTSDQQIVNARKSMYSIPTFRLTPDQTYEMPTFDFLPEHIHVSGVAVDSDGNPISGALVSVRQPANWHAASVRGPTDKDGRFTLWVARGVPMTIDAHVLPPWNAEDRSIRLRGKVEAMPDDKNIRIILVDTRQSGRTE